MRERFDAITIGARRLLLGLAALTVMSAFAQTPPPNLATATFAAGCFWCTEEALDKVPGVVSTTSGYMGGSKRNPTYQEVSSGTTGHTEVVQVVYDPAKVSYERLLEVFWLNIDPTVKDRQFCDSGAVPPRVFYHRRGAEAARRSLQGEVGKDKPFKEPIVTPIVTAGEF